MNDELSESTHRESPEQVRLSAIYDARLAESPRHRSAVRRMSALDSRIRERTRILVPGEGWRSLDEFEGRVKK